MENNFVPSEKLNLWQPLRKVLLFIGLAMLFNLGVLFFKGSQAALEFLGGYLIEFSLSLDNLFVFISIFTAFGISEHSEHRVLTYGIMGAVILRLIFISLGVQVVNHFHFILYIFGAVLIINGIKMFFQKEHEYDVKNHKMMRFLRRFVPMTEEMVGEKFFVKIDGKRMITPLFAVLMIIEGSDILFAIDSIPAVFSVTTDLFIVYTSNIFAILGLRQLYFVLLHLQERFQYVRYGVATILTFTGVKLGLLMFHIEISIPISISVIFGILALSIILSMVMSKKKTSTRTD